jgi:hypothetical protein
MKHRSLLLIILTIFIITFGIALSESAQTDIFSYGEWDWDNESLNTFNGSVDVSQWAGTDLTLMMKAEFEPKSESASEIIPKYTHFNGKRLPMLKQSDTMTYTPEEGQGTVGFEGSLQMPEKDHFQKITLVLSVTNPEGKELKKISTTVSATGGDSATQKSNIFYISFEIRTVAIIIAAAAALVWCLAIIRNQMLNREKITGD